MVFEEEPRPRSVEEAKEAKCKPPGVINDLKAYFTDELKTLLDL